MDSIQFISYNLTFLLIVAHFLDSCKEQEWTEPIYLNNYLLQHISSTIIIGTSQIGIIPIYLESKIGNWFSICTAIAGIGAGGYHVPLHLIGKSKVCDNKFSYWLMVFLTISCLVLLISTIKNMFKKEEKIPYNQIQTSVATI